MSFELNDMNTIHRGNYEEFFILYMDNELSDEQKKMVDEFLLHHPDLEAEFQVLMMTKLPSEEFKFDKTDLLAESMKQSLVDEELLLYIDNELPADKKNTVELELASNKDYQLQHQLLLQTKLNPSEKIEYPNKKELYRHTEKIVTIKIWMRVAAAVIILAISGIVYFKNSSPSVVSGNSGPVAEVRKNTVPTDQVKSTKTNSESASPENEPKVAVIESPENTTPLNQTIKQKSISKENTEDITPKNTTASTPQNTEEKEEDRSKVKHVPFDAAGNTIAQVEPMVPVNKADVTSPLVERIDNSTGDDAKLFASNDRKGSIKGFLRKATRMIEKRTGIDPTNDNGELLIGAVAINLK